MGPGRDIIDLGEGLGHPLLFVLECHMYPGIDIGYQLEGPLVALPEDLVFFHLIGEAPTPMSRA